MSSENEDPGDVMMVNLSLSNDDNIDYTVNLRVIGMMCQKNCGKVYITGISMLKIENAPSFISFCQFRATSTNMI
jgi:hypothetical protein